MRKASARDTLLSTYGSINKVDPVLVGSVGLEDSGPVDSLGKSNHSSRGSPTSLKSKAKILPTLEAALQAGIQQDDRLPVGIIEYVTVIGPSRLPPVKLVGDKPSIPAPPADIDEINLLANFPRSSSFSDREGESEESVESGGSEEYDALEDGMDVDIDAQDKVMDVHVYDRFPKQDYPKSPLPPKVEWFAFPEGSLSVASADRYNI